MVLIIGVLFCRVLIAVFRGCLFLLFGYTVACISWWLVCWFDYLLWFGLLLNCLFITLGLFSLGGVGCRFACCYWFVVYCFVCVDCWFNSVAICFFFCLILFWCVWLYCIGSVALCVLFYWIVYFVVVCCFVFGLRMLFTCYWLYCFVDCVVFLLTLLVLICVECRFVGCWFTLCL